MTAQRIYLDYNTVTMIDSVVVAVIKPFLDDHYGNSSQ